MKTQEVLMKSKDDSLSFASLYINIISLSMTRARNKDYIGTDRKNELILSRIEQDKTDMREVYPDIKSLTQNYFPRR